MKRLVGFLLMGLIVAGAVSACDEESTVRDEVIQALCGGSDACCKADGKPSSVDACQKFYGLFAGPVADEGLARTCIDQINAARQAGTFCGVDPDVVAPACDSVFGKTSGSNNGGSKQPGELCQDSDECAEVAGATSVFCSTDFTSTPEGSSQTRYCEVTVTKAEGEDCADLPKGYRGQCNEKDGAYCDSKSKKCKLPAPQGAECSPNSFPSSCQKGLLCANKPGEGGAPSTYLCEPRLADGASCENASSSCLEASYCSTDKVCTPSLADGSPCTSSQTCASKSCVNNKCAEGFTSGYSLCFTDD